MKKTGLRKVVIVIMAILAVSLFSFCESHGLTVIRKLSII